MTLVPVPTKTARCHSDIKGRRPFDVPAVLSIHFQLFGRYGKGAKPRAPEQRLCVLGIQFPSDH